MIIYQRFYLLNSYHTIVELCGTPWSATCAERVPFESGGNLGTIKGCGNDNFFPFQISLHSKCIPTTTKRTTIQHHHPLPKGHTSPILLPLYPLTSESLDMHYTPKPPILLQCTYNIWIWFCSSTPHPRLSTAQLRDALPSAQAALWISLELQVTCAWKEGFASPSEALLSRWHGTSLPPQQLGGEGKPMLYLFADGKWTDREDKIMIKSPIKIRKPEFLILLRHRIQEVDQNQIQSKWDQGRTRQADRTQQ